MINLKHPIYTSQIANWEKFRLTYEGGREFVDTYLKRYSIRETNTEFLERRELTYCPNFAGQAIREIKNSIFSRMPDVRRDNESNAYQEALRGNEGGIDYYGGSIDNFVGTRILPEMLVLGHVGVYVDMPRVTPITKLDESTVHPYYYTYRAEDILTWTSGPPESGHEFIKLLLVDNYYLEDPEHQLITGQETRYRLLEVNPSGGVDVTFLNAQDEKLEEYHLDIPKIPFVLFKLDHSLLQDAADYQIALLNLESTDINFARKANFPVYTEQINYATAMAQIRQGGQEETDDDGNTISTIDPVAGAKKIALGPATGRQYNKGLDRPEFIHPSPAPLQVAMEKEDQLKRDIRLLVHLATAGLGNKSISAESKQIDKESLESGLSLIALVLEEGERKLAVHWNNYERNKKVPVIAYPRNFNLRTDVERRTEARELGKLSHDIPSQTFKREMMKKIVNILIGGQVQIGLIETINKEIETAKSVTSDPATIINDWEAGFVTTDTASVIRGYPEDEAEKAKLEKAERIKKISEAQGGATGEARGVDDMQIDEESSSEEKEGKQKRGQDKDQRVEK